MNLLLWEAMRKATRKQRVSRHRPLIVDEGETQEHKRSKQPVSIKRAYLRSRSKYLPRTASRPKENLKAMARVLGCRWRDIVLPDGMEVAPHG